MGGQRILFRRVCGRGRKSGDRSLQHGWAKEHGSYL